MESNGANVATEGKIYPRYRWVMLVIVMGMTMLYSTVLMLPSSLITTISEETGWTLGQTGTFNSIVALLMGIFALCGSFVLDKLGPKNTAVIALAIGALGGILAFFGGTSYMIHLAGRFLVGVSWGIFFVVPAVVIADWFPSEKQSFFQGMRGSFDLFGAGVAFYIVLPIFYLVKSWQITFGVFGVAMGALMLIYIVFGRDRNARVKPQESIQPVVSQRGESGLKMAAKNKYIWFLTLGVVGKIFAFNTFTTYLPAFLEKERGYSLTEASAMAGLTALVGIASGLVMGALASLTGRRRVMGWPMLAMVTIGGVIALYAESTILVAIGSSMIGWGVTGNMAYYCTVPVDISGGNGSFIAGSTALIMFLSFSLSYFVPDLFQGLLDSGYSIQKAMLMSLIPNTILLVPVMLIPETGAKAKINPLTLFNQ